MANLSDILATPYQGTPFERIYYLDPFTTGPGLAGFTPPAITNNAFQAAAAAGTINPGFFDITDEADATTCYYYWPGGRENIQTFPMAKTRLTLSPYIATTNGENRLIVLGNDEYSWIFPDIPAQAFVLMPGNAITGMTNSDNSVLANTIDDDFRYEIDGALSDGAFIIGQEWDSTSQHRLFETATTEEVVGLFVSVRRHMVVEYYGHPRAKGARTSHRWCAVGLHGLIMSTNNHDGWGNQSEVNKASGYSQRFTLTMQQYRTLLANADIAEAPGDTGSGYSYIDITVPGSPWTFTCSSEDQNRLHYFHGVQDADLTIRLPDNPPANFEKFKFLFAHPITPKFTTVTGTNKVDGSFTATPLSRVHSGKTYVEFIGDENSQWKSLNNSTKEERVYELDAYDTGCWARDRGTVATWMDVTSPLAGDSCWDTSQAAFHYCDGVTWASWGAQNPALQPYIALSNGENRIRLKNKLSRDGEGTAFIVLPSIGSGNTTIETIVQQLTYDEPIHLDTAYENQIKGAVIFANGWTNTDYSAQGNAKQIHKKYPSIPPFWAHRMGDLTYDSFGGCIELNQNTHISFEPYPGDSSELPGARTRVQWHPTNNFGILFKRANDSTTDGWGNRIDITRNGFAQRFTLGEREWEDVSSTVYTDLGMDQIAASVAVPYDIYAEWEKLRSEDYTYDAVVNTYKKHILIDPSKATTGGLNTGDAYFVLPDPAVKPVGTKITFYNSTSNGVRDCRIFASGSALGGQSFMYQVDPLFSNQEYYVHTTASGTGVTFINQGSSWNVRPINYGGMDKKGWGNAPDFTAGISPGYPIRFTLKEKELLTIPNIPDNMQMDDATAGINWAADWDLNAYKFKVIHLDLNVSNRTMRMTGLGNGTYTYIFNHTNGGVGYSLTLDPTAGGTNPTFTINGLSSLVIPTNTWIQLVNISDSVDEYRIIASSNAALINGASSGGSGSADIGQHINIAMGNFLY
jgi:hypothetical protein